MAPKLYVMDVSPPVRAVYFTANALGISLEYEEIDMDKKDHLTPQFIKLNPQHTIPLLVDDGHVIWDSHAINLFLIAKYAKNDELYPKDIYKRAIIDQRLHFDSGVIFSMIRRMLRPMIDRGVKTIPEELINETNVAYDFLEKFLQGRLWVADDRVTVADFSLLSSITSLNVIVPINAVKFPNILAWIKRGEALPYYDRSNKKGLEDFKTLKQLLMG